MIELGPFVISGGLAFFLLRHLILPRLETWLENQEWYDRIPKIFSEVDDEELKAIQISGPENDRLGFLGVGAAGVAFVLWAFPKKLLCNGTYCREVDFWIPPQPNLFGELSRESWIWFTNERLPAIAAFLVLSFVLLLLRDPSGARRVS